MSEISICNQALALLAIPPIISFEDGTTASGLCSRLYAPMRNHVLEERAWTFATDRDTLLPDTTAPDWGYEKRFLIPTEWLRILSVTDIVPINAGQSNSIRPFEWNREGRYILGNADKVYVQYVKVVSDTSQFSSNFNDCLAYRMAAEMAIALTENRTIFENMTAMYNRKLIEASLTDGGQGRRQEKYLGSYVLRR